MAQTFQALKCFKCQTFQVQIKKKGNRWACKLCGEKQSFMQIYGEGTSKDCRIHVQRLNSLRAAEEEAKRAKLEEANESEDNEASSSLEHSEEDESGNVSGTSRPKSKWSAYLDNDGENADSESEEEEVYQPVNTHSRRKSKSNSKWGDYLDDDSKSTAHGKRKRKAEQMTSSNKCSRMNHQQSQPHNEHEEILEDKKHLHEQNYSQELVTDSKGDAGKATNKAFPHCSSSKINHDVRGSKRNFAVNTQFVDQITSNEDKAKVFCSNDNEDLDEVLKL